MRRRTRATRRVLRYRAPKWTILALIAALATAAALSGLVLAGGIVIATLVLAWLAIAVRRLPLTPAGDGRRGGGFGPPGGAGVREPRRPRPHAPAGAAALPRPADGP
jgi:hypothetical protein